MGNLNRDSSERVVSIPSKHRAAGVSSNSEKKGFCSQTKRFTSQLRLRESPGPGSYNLNRPVECPSFSTKGTTGFIPLKEIPAALSHPRRHFPGPSTYNLQSSMINKHDFNTGVSRVFRTPVAVQKDTLKNSSPAPNQYNVQRGGGERFGPSGSSVFVSKTKRDPYNVNKDQLSPCQYYVDSEFPHGSKAVVSPFRSKTPRVAAPKDNHAPGPGAYSPHQSPAPVRRPRRLRRSVLTISAPPPLMPKPPPSPGPGHYDVSRTFSSKHAVPSAAFASRSERIAHAHRTSCPGPGSYDPYVSSKPSFFYCDSRIWLPV